MYKVINRNGSVFGTEPCSCEFVCDTTDDVSTLPTSITEGTGGKTKYDNQVCGSGSIAVVIDNGSNPKRYILDNQDAWCPNDPNQSAKTVLEEAKAYTDAEITDLINGAPTTRDTLKEISDLMDENASVVEALNAAIGTKANKTDIPTKTSELENDSGFLTKHQDLSAYAKTADLSNAVSSINTTLNTKANKTDIPTKTSELENDSGFLTEHQDLSAYAKSADVNAALGNKADASHTHNIYASAELYSKTGINFGRKANTVNGYKSTAEGTNTTASGDNSHAEGFIAIASGNYSHAEGNYTTASGADSHAEGYSTTASGADSHAEGIVTTASGESSHAEGYSTTASCDNSHASGHFNADMVTGGTGRNTVGTAFVIGNGTSGTVKSNAFSVMFDGTVKAKSTITASTTADYAEFFEWLDGNSNEEDRVGYFVTMDGDKIRIANSDDDYILGVVSGEPFVLGNGDCDTWNGMFLRDEFRRTIYEPAPKMKEILDDNGNPTGEYVEVEGEYEGTRPKLNPDYDHTKKYISRFDRKEWAPIGMLGVLAVRHDGTAKVNGYVTVAEGGIATACDKNTENSYRVIKSNSDSVVEIIFR